MSVVSGVISRDCAHTCVLIVLQKQGKRCHSLLCGCVGRYICVAECYVGSFNFIAHTCVLQKPGFRGCTFLGGAAHVFFFYVRAYMCGRIRQKQ